MSFYLNDGVVIDDDETPSSTSPPPFHRNRHGRTYTPHTESLVGLFSSLPLDDETTWGSTRPRHPPPPPTLRSSSNCYGSFVPLPKKSTQCDDDDDYEGNGDPFDSIVGRRKLDAPPNNDSSQYGGRDEKEEDDGIMIERSSTSFLVRRDGKEEGPWSSFPFIEGHDLAVYFTQTIRPAMLGSFLFPLYQLVFCFAEASAITRPSQRLHLSGVGSSTYSLLSPMALAACVGSLISGPMLITMLGHANDYPALYPCLDMFMAPFLAQMAADVDEGLLAARTTRGRNDAHDVAVAYNDDDDDAAAFLATFAALNAFSMIMCGLFCVLAGRIKLANLASYLPYPVLCGFFSSVGLSVWLSAFKVDAGMTVGMAFANGILISRIGRHVPSVIAGVGMYFLGPRGPHYLLGALASTIAAAYVVMMLSGTTLEMAREMNFFWGAEEVMTGKGHRPLFGFGPPMPFGLLSMEAWNAISWPAFMNGLHGVVAMSVIYLLRCSLNAAAMKKLAKERRRPYRSGESLGRNSVISMTGDRRSSMFSVTAGALKEKSKPRDLLAWYANSFFAIALSGGFAVLPALGLGGIFWKIGAAGRAPQYGGYLVLLLFYVNDFGLCTYVPKCTFSSLLVMAALDLTNTWFIRSYRKSPEEWPVVPLIVGTSIVYGSLPSVGIGLCASTLIFVASFQRAGVVKFVASGLTVRSTIERNCEDNMWLDENGGLIQILVLQNYFFFGNASTCLGYFELMFDDECDLSDTHPTPKYVILDLSIMTGIDASAIDVLADISSLCKENRCKIIFTGIPQMIGASLERGGVRPSASNRHLSIELEIEAALGKAEDELLKYVGHKEERTIAAGNRLRHIRRVSMIDHGLRHALRAIDKQHDLQMAMHLEELEIFTTPVELGVDVAFCSRPGLYFVESGLIKCEYDASTTVRRTGGGTALFGQTGVSADSGHCELKNGLGNMPHNKAFRLARIGPGWVIGSLSGALGREMPGIYTPVTPCRVHYLTLETINELEESKPVLVMHLYKLISRLATHRQEMIIGQLATLRSIMSATAQTIPNGRLK